MKIGVFGGTFNPPHIAHLKIATECYNFDKIYFVPSGPFYEKQDIIPFEHRFHMLELMINDNPNFTNVFISDFENQKHNVETIQTLDYFHSLFPNDEIYLVIGSDNLRDIHNWNNYKRILNQYNLLVSLRDEDSEKDFNFSPQQQKHILFFPAISTCEHISSTQIRSSIRNNKYETINNLLSPHVIKYIKENKLYN